MGINRENYEVWFLDYADGNLNEQQVADLMLFLVQNPDLKEELEEDFGEVALQAEPIAVPNKEEFKQEVVAITAANYEDFLVAELEGELSSDELVALQAFLKQNPAFQQDRVLFQKTRIQPDLSVRYTDKQGLKRRKAIVLPLYMRYVAAAVVIIFAIFLFYQREPAVDGPSIVNVDTPDSSTTQLVVDDSREIKEVSEEKESLLADTIGTGVDVKELIAIEEPAPIVNPEQKGVRKDKDNSLDGPIEEKSIEKNVVQVEFPSDKVDSRDFEAPIPVPTPFESKDITTTAIAAVDVPVSDISRPSQPGMTVWEYAGRQIKENVLDEEDVADGRIRETDVALAFSKGVDRISKKEVDFKNRSNKERVSYGVSIGKFGFSRTKTRKNKR